MELYIPAYGNYYHFITESVMGLFRTLRDCGKLHSKDCRLWYSGNYGHIVQYFTRHPIEPVKNVSALPAGVTVLPHIRPKILSQWLELRSLSDFFLDRMPARPFTKGVTVIKRVRRRKYADHDGLISLFTESGIAVREAIMENLTFEYQIELMRQTAVLIGPHGSGETNMMFMPTGSVIIELYPKGFTDRVFRGMAQAFQHQLVEIEATKPSVIGRKPTGAVKQYLESHEWPTRQEFMAWTPNPMELGRVLRDVESFSIDPAVVLAMFRRRVFT